MILQGNAGYPVTEVVLHCAAIRTGQFNGFTPFQAFSEINRWHIERGFSGFGYHGLFMPGGAFFPGRPFAMIGAHCIERNRGSLGFLMIESKRIGEIGSFGDYFTIEQRHAVRAAISTIPGIQTVSGHNDYAPKLCPGFKVKSSDWI
jgi:N-acetylmuramoyl-L-alanine amidase